MSYDYSGDMDFYQRQLAAVGVTKDMFDISNYLGLTASELQNIVNHIIKQVKAKEAK